MNPLSVVCPAWNAQPGQPCTTPQAGPVGSGRKPVTWVHHSRESVASTLTYVPPPRPPAQVRNAGIGVPTPAVRVVIQTADSDGLNQTVNEDGDLWHDDRGVVWSSAEAALQDFLDDLPALTAGQQEEVFQFTRHDAPAAFNLHAIAHGIAYTGHTEPFKGYPVPIPGDYVVPSVNEDDGSLDPIVWQKIITLGDVAEAAADLRSESGENPEYDRALTEVICSFIEGGSDYREDVEHYLSTLNEGDKK